MDATDKALLDIIQGDFPLVPRPYAEIGARLGIAEEEALDRVRALRQGRIIRRMGANFQSKKLGWVSTLCGAKVPAEVMDRFVELVNAEPGVTHNYEREHAYNIWFTFIGPSRAYIQERLDAITEQTGVPILNLPATKLFKIRVNFKLAEDEA
ncbi:MAG: AsnC family transcriptional regulator [Desulfovibrionaceae bacterium]|nr:AsnC family transcriptional regulator [Desulfovibrionaceae bacterium]